MVNRPGKHSQNEPPDDPIVDAIQAEGQPQSDEPDGGDLGQLRRPREATDRGSGPARLENYRKRARRS